MSNSPDSSITIFQEPMDCEAPLGSYVNLAASIVARKPKFQWFNEAGDPIPNATESFLTFHPVKKSDFGSYRLEITDQSSQETLQSRWAVLKSISLDFYRRTLPPIPTLRSKPIGGEFQQGEMVELVGEFENADSYQWYHNGMMLPRMTSNKLLILAATPEHSGQYCLEALSRTGFDSVNTDVQIC